MCVMLAYCYKLQLVFRDNSSKVLIFSKKDIMSKQIAEYEHKTQENEMANLKRRFKKHGVTDDDLESQCSDISVNSKAIAIEIKLLRKSLKKLDAELS